MPRQACSVQGSQLRARLHRTSSPPQLPSHPCNPPQTTNRNKRKRGKAALPLSQGTHLHHLVVHLGVEHAGDKAGPDALDLVRAGAAAAQHGGLCRFHCHHLQPGLLRCGRLREGMLRCKGVRSRAGCLDECKQHGGRAVLEGPGRGRSGSLACDLRYSPAPVMVPPVPTPLTKKSIWRVRRMGRGGGRAADGR